MSTLAQVFDHYVDIGGNQCYRLKPRKSYMK